MEYALEQVNFDVDDSRCGQQKFDSFAALVNYDSEFPNPTSTSNNDKNNKKNSSKL
jgi:hypothetical protein